MQNTNNFVASLFKPVASKPSGRKVWSMDLETVLLPFFVATNTMGVSDIPLEAIGAPIRLAYNTDGSVKFSKAGKPVMKVAKEINDAVRLNRENYIAGLQSYAHEIATKNGKEYNLTVSKAIKAGQPIKDLDAQNLNDAIDKLVKAGIDHAESEAQSKESQTPEPVKV